jgi:hypothetical protein
MREKVSMPLTLFTILLLVPIITFADQYPGAQSASGTDNVLSSISGFISSFSSYLIGPLSDNNPPAKAYVPAGDLAGRSGKTYSYSTKAIDPDGDDVKYTFDWGDGTTSVTSLVSSDTSENASHIWTVAPGTTKAFIVRAKATDEHGMDGIWSNSVSIYIIAEKLQRPPAIPSKPVGPTSGTTGMTYNFSTSSTDPDGDKIKYIFDWGDGTSETGYFPSGQVVTMSHSWNNVPVGKTWTYNVQVLCSDSRVMMCPYPYWSEPLIVAITGVAAGTDTTKPTVSLTSPSNGTKYSTAQTVSIAATASDNVGVSKVVFYDGSNILGTDTSSPYSYSWPITASNNGPHLLTAWAYDTSNNTATSSTVSVTINISTSDTTAPTVSLTAPANNTIVSAVTTISAIANDNVGVTNVVFYDGSTILGNDSSSPYTYSWNTASVSNGPHSLTSKAYDAAGNSKVSSIITVTVSNSVDTALLQGFKYRVPINISNTVSNQSNYAVNIMLPYNGHMQKNLSDIRFTKDDGVTKLNYWVDQYNYTNKSSFWVNVDALPKGNSKIYLYYGNSTVVSESNGLSTFDFYEDFDDGYVGDWILSTSCVRGTKTATTAYYRSKTYSLMNYVTGACGASYSYSLRNFTAQATSTYMIDFYTKSQGCSGCTISSRLFVDGTQLFSQSIAGVMAPKSVSKSLTAGIHELKVGMYTTTSSKGTFPAYFDDIHVRKYISPEPAYSLGSEEIIG